MTTRDSTVSYAFEMPILPEDPRDDDGQTPAMFPASTFRSPEWWRMMRASYGPEFFSPYSGGGA
ncbi:MAG: hypothetical protein EBR34_16490 [Sphingomonadaceae bacterium]|nr:hypothetical protein [Sphingomonadaceae bacterium]